MFFGAHCRWLVLIIGLGIIPAKSDIAGFLIEKTADGQGEAVPFSELYWESPDGGSITTLSGTPAPFEKAKVDEYIFLDETYWRGINSNSSYLPFRKDILGREVVIPGIKLDISTDSDIKPYSDGSAALQLVTKLAPSFKDTLSQIQSQLDDEMAHYQKGDRKIGGKWLSSADLAARAKEDDSESPQSFSITTIDGKTYKNVTNLKVDSDTVSFVCSTGGATIDLAILTPDLQRKFGYDPRAREQQRIADEKAKADADAAAQAAVLAQREQADADVTAFTLNTSKNTLTGQVFIATSGGNNIKLGDVHVYLFALSQMNLIVGPKNREAVKQVTALNAELEKESKQYEAADAASQNQDALVENGEYVNPASRKAALQKSMESLEASRQVFLSPDYYFSDLPSPLAEADTDADGKFTMSLPLGKYVLVAKASRSVLLQDEHYWWMVKFDMGSLARSFSLSNNNLSNSGSDDSLIVTQ
jgi:hypothetical protein